MKEVDGAKVKLKRKNNSVKVFKFQDKCNSIRRYAILRLHNTRSYCTVLYIHCIVVMVVVITITIHL